MDDIKVFFLQNVIVIFSIYIIDLRLVLRLDLRLDLRDKSYDTNIFSICGELGFKQKMKSVRKWQNDFEFIFTLYLLNQASITQPIEFE